MGRSKKRVVFCTYSSIYSSIVLKALLACSDIHVVGIVNSTRNYKSGYSAIQGSLQYIRDTGWFYSLYLFFITDVYQLIQLLGGKKNIHSLAKKHNIPLLNTQDVNDEAGQKFVEEQKPDYILSAHFNQLFKENIFTIPSITSLNMHPSLLPAYRGVDPVFYAMLRDEKQIGVTVHLIDNDFDTGNIVAQEIITADASRSLLENNIDAFSMGATLVVDAITHSIRTTIVQHESGHYDSWPTPKLVKQFRQSKKHLLTFSNVRKYFL